ncbi:MAG: glycoside hydrolase family 38 C-terminal domain-containing protein [Kiritimatiellae bacterium]|nr:glycoside hydrolase family 38 C-terminal domain-containing protein [Kiritimatiellia bacterium]
MNNPKWQADYGDSWLVERGPVNGALLRTAPVHQTMPESGTRVTRKGSVGCKAVDADCLAWPEPHFIHQHPLQGTIEFRYPQIGLTTHVTLRADESLVRFRALFLPRGKKYRLRVAFPTTIRKGRIRHSVPCGHLERPEGEYAIQGWMDYADEEKGLLLLNRGLPGNNVTHGVMMLSLFRAVSLENHEQTSWYEEGIEHIFEYALMPFDPKNSAYNPARIAALYNRPVVGLPVRNVTIDGLRNHASEPLIELRGDGAELSCIQRQDNVLVVRLWESRGRASHIAFRFRKSLVSCIRTDAVGNRIGVERCAGRSVSLSLRPFEIVTLHIRF